MSTFVLLILPEVRLLLRNKEKQKLTSILKDFHPVDICEIIENLEKNEYINLFKLLDEPKQVEVFEQLEQEYQAHILKNLERHSAVKLLETMSPDDRVDFLKSIPEEEVEMILPLLAQAERNDIKKLYAYKEGTAGSIMTTEYAAISADLIVEEALQKLKQVAPDSETIYYVYVVDKDKKLIGFVSLKDLIIAPRNAIIKDIMHKKVISVNINDDQEVVAQIIATYDFLAVPVVDKEKRLVGLVTVDDVVDVIHEEATEDMYKFGAAGERAYDYLKSSVYAIAKQRILWLLVLVAAGFFSGLIMESFEGLLSSMVTLTFFIPLLCDSGGNAGTQSATVIVRGLATGEVNVTDVFRIVKKEIAISIVVGIAMSLLAILRAVFVHSGSWVLVVTVGSVMFVNVIVSTVLGAILPIIFQKLKFDPALMSGPLITTIVDIFTVGLYLITASILINTFI